MKSINAVLFLALSLFMFQPVQAQFRHGQVIFLQSANNPALHLATLENSTRTQSLLATQPRNSSNADLCKWKLENAGDGYFFLRNVKTTFMMDVKWGADVSGTGLWLHPANRTNAQKFKFVRSLRRGGTYYSLVPKVNERLRVDLLRTTPRAGTRAVILTEEQGRGTQSWKVVSADVARPVPPRSPEVPGESVLRLPKATFAAMTNGALGKMEIRLSNHGPRHRDRNGDVSWYKPNDSYIKFEGYQSTFTIEEHSRGVRDKRSYIYDMRLTRAQARFAGNDLSLNLRFEEDGPEIKSYCGNCIKAREDNGSPDYQFQNNAWDIRLKLVPYNGSIAYEVKSVRFLGEVDGRVFGELWDGIVQRCLIPVIEQNMKRSLDNRKGDIARLIESKAREWRVDLPYVTRIAFEGNMVLLYGRSR